MKKENIYLTIPILISTITLLVFIYQTNLIQQQQYMSVYPHLKLFNENSNSLNYQYVLSNLGIGPAFITKIEVKDTNDHHYQSVNEYLATKLSINDSIWIHNSDIYEGQLLPANTKVVLYGLHSEEECQEMGLNPNTQWGASKLRSILNSEEFSLKITYKSIYGEHWSIEKGKLFPIKL